MLPVDGSGVLKLLSSFRRISVSHCFAFELKGEV